MDKRLAYLKKLGATNLGHWNGDLISHLQSTSALLADWGAPQYLQDAGLFHAVYGTDGYPETLLDADARRQIVDIIGGLAEQVVYAYGACDRDYLYPQLGKTPGKADEVTFRDRFNGEIQPLSGRLLEDICELTGANELDLASGSAKFRLKHGAKRYRFFHQISTYLSPAALRATDEILGEYAEAEPAGA